MGSVSQSVSYVQIFSSAPCPQTLIIPYSFFGVREQVTNSYNKTGKIINLYILISIL
jgi:hypothetical protein